MEINNFKIADGEKLYLDGIELKNVSKYELSHSAENIAELTISLEVSVNPILSKENEINQLINENQSKLETILLKTIEKELSKPSSEHYMEDVSVMAQTLIELRKL